MRCVKVVAVVDWRGYMARQGVDFVAAVVVEDEVPAAAAGAEMVGVARAEWVYERQVRWQR